MKTVAVLSVILTGVCFAVQVIQSDWAMGPGVAGPTGSWASCFDSSQDISWLAVPGQLVLASVQLADPVLHAVTNTFTGVYTVDVGDLNGDGLNDIIGGGISVSGFCVWYAGVSGGWVKEIISSTADSPTGCDIVDIDDDGDLDILCATYYGERVLLFLNDGSPTPLWTEVVISPYFAGGHDVESFDMDDDGDPDILAAAAEGDMVAE
ncbi:MAG: VCBS repeat-containing protein [Candidatus Aegiribacteria sp.]|nr:VCBS repeat-containing protein [Candidatus Aegiribacteria sp.]